MEDQLFEMLRGLGVAAPIVALLAWLLREARIELKELRALQEALRAAHDARCEKYQARIDDLQDKRLHEALSLQQLVEASNTKDDALLAAFKRDAA